MVDHCYRKLELGIYESANSTCVKVDGTKYTVRKGNNGTVHEVDLADPSCNCYSWKRTKLPCKHFFILFHHQLESWNSLPESFRNSVYLSLDTEVFQNCYVKPDNTDNVTTGDVVHDAPASPKDNCDADDDSDITEDVNHNATETLADLPKKKILIRSKLASCRELMKEITSLTYLVNDEEVI